MLHAVIMAGGVGSRFWPRSRQARPKQFLDVFGPSSLIQNTAQRLQGLVTPDETYVVTNAAYVGQTQEHLPAVPAHNVLAEPVARNTAPCIAYAARTVLAEDPDGVMVVLPADHLIRNVARFQTVIRAAAERAQTPDADGRYPLVTIGITPTHPETGYGYIQFDGEQGDDASGEPQAFPVKTFAEKPDLATAERFLDAGDFLWNAGMFIWRADAVLAAMERHLPEVAEAFDGIGSAASTPKETVREAYERTPKISIDYGVMERATAAGDPVYVVPGSFGWSDVGDWRAVYSLAEKDAAGNATEGEVVLHNAARCYARADGRLLALVGVTDVAVIDTGDAVLVCDIEQAQQVKNVVDFLGSRGMTDYV